MAEDNKNELQPTQKTVDEKAQENRQKVQNAQVVNSSPKPAEQKDTPPTPSNAPVQEVKEGEQSEADRNRIYTEGLKAQEQEGLKNRENNESFVNANNQIINPYGTFPAPDEDVIVQGSGNGNREFRRAQEEGKRQQALQEFTTQQREEEEAKAGKSKRRQRK